MKFWKTPTPDQVDRAVALLGQEAQYRYFFDRLNNPEWIKPLKSKGYFSNPPRAQRDEVRGTIRVPPWPESRYLARMAPLKPEAVLGVIQDMPHTDNVRVYEDLADAALGMPSELSARLVERAKSWARAPYQFLLPEKLGALVAHLTRGGRVDEALGLTQVLLEVLSGRKEEAESEIEEVHRVPREPRARFDIWHYDKILKKDFPELVKAAGIRAINILCDQLERGIRFSQRGGHREGTKDYSYIWRRAIENHTQNRVHTLRDFLVTGIRDSAELLVQGNPPGLAELVQVLKSRSWSIFHRILLHLLRRFPNAAPDLVVPHLLDRSLFNDIALRHEYALLLGDCFGVLREEQKRTVLDWIDEGPPAKELQGIGAPVTGGQSSVESAERYRKGWQCKRLAWIKRHLSGEWKQRYEGLVAECGEPEHPEFEVYIKSWTGPTSPVSVEDIRSMSIEQIVNFLMTWRPSSVPMNPSPEGLGRTLTSVVTSDPARFSVGAGQFQALDPTYVRALISGLRDGAKAKSSFSWLPVLDLCRWVVEQPREIPGRNSEYADLDPGWVWTRKAIADLLSEGLEEGQSCLSFENRLTVWEILRPITDDLEPSQDYEARYGGSNTDPATLSINTTRGEAMHAVVRYALWVRRHLERLPDARQRVQRGFDEMTEVREVLERHLDVSLDPSLAIRAVYGQWFPWLVLLDANWAKTHIAEIFPAADSEQALHNAAWETYITFCDPYDIVFEILSEQYAVAVERLGAPSGERRRLADPDEQLAEHLMAFYWRGKLDLDDPENLFAQFWKKAPDVIRGHALGFIGRTLYDWGEAVAPQVLQRLMILWEDRLAAAREVSISEAHEAEMAAFGWWFVSGKFEDAWAVKQLAEALKIVRKTEHENVVVERLAGLSQQMPLEAVQCLEAIAKGDKEGWDIYGWRQHASTILSTALAESNPETRTAAENLIHYLGSRGYFQFGELLRATPPAGG